MGEIGRRIEAVEALELAIALDPYNPIRRTRAVQLMRGWNLRENARDLLERAIMQFPPTPQFHEIKGDLALDDGNNAATPPTRLKYGDKCADLRAMMATIETMMSEMHLPLGQ